MKFSFNGEALKRYTFSSLSENKLSDFRPIALLNVECKLFFSLVSKCLETHLIHKNKFIRKSIQKGSRKKIPGYWEHLCMVWHALKGASVQKSNLAIVWLDIANAYRSIPTNWLFLLYIDMVSLHSGSDLLKHATKGFSVNYFVDQQLVLGIDINREFLVAALFL